MRKIAILYGSETGNAQDCASDLGKALARLSMPAKLSELREVAPEDLLAYELTIFVCSTFGSGDAPTNAEAFFVKMKNEKPALGGLKFTVCALGDSTFENFAKPGRDLDRMLEEAGGERVLPRVDCDAEYEVSFEEFKQAVLAYATVRLEALRSDGTDSEAREKKGGFFSFLGRLFGGGKKNSADAAEPIRPRPLPGTHREAPFDARLVSSRLLSGEGSAKETRHYTLDISGAAFRFQTGDCVGLYPKNCEDEVRELLSLLGLEGTTRATFGETEGSLEALLLEKTCLQRVTVKLVDAIAPFSRSAREAREGGAKTLDAFIAAHHVLDVFREAEAPRLDAETLLGVLRPLAPRLFSIASSPLTNPTAIDLTIETLRYERDGRTVKGVASTWLADRAKPGDVVPLYLHPGDHFRVPGNDVPALMIGPGTGIAPFRAFLEEREKRGATGKNWLFFGHQHENSDFLYREELEAWEKRGVLSRLVCAWSRDQAEKVYVQHRLRELGDDVWALLEAGAVVYVCGDAHHMAHDVHEELIALAKSHGVVDGAAWIAELERSGRYRRDVY